jgi:predicted Zn-dependent protease
MRLRLMGLAAACLVLTGYTPCLNRLMNDPLGGARHIAETNSRAEQRAAQIEKECKVLEGRQVNFEEEHSLGGAVSLNWVSTAGGLVLAGAAPRSAEAPRPLHKELHQQLNRIGKNLAAQSARPHLPWTFGVLNSPGFNAVSGPGGYVFVSEGLLAQLENEAQLAGVLAHEIAHINEKHAVREYQQLLVRECRKRVEAEKRSALEADAAAGMGNAAKEVGYSFTRVIPLNVVRNMVDREVDKAAFDIEKAGLEFIRGVTNQLVDHLTTKGFPKEDELAADVAALELMASAGYAPEEYITFLAKVPEKGLSTAHPAKAERQKRLQDHLATLKKSSQGQDFTPVSLQDTRKVELREALQQTRTRLAGRVD